MSQSLELEIKDLLDQNPGDDPDRLIKVGESLIASLEGSEDGLLPENITTLSRFLLHAGLYRELISFCLRHLRNEAFKVPWPYFLEAIRLSGDSISNELADALLIGIDHDDARGLASRSRALDARAPTLKAERADRRLQALKAARRQKENLLEQLITLRTQQLYEQERLVLQKLQKMYPRDPEVLREVQAHKERYALEILSKHSRFSRRIRFEENSKDPDVEALKPALADLLIETASQEPAYALDFAVAAGMLEMWETALSLLEFSEDSEQARWLRLELLLLAGRHLELLAELARLELLYADDSETFFATAYLRAQALWGLGQKHAAIDVMESLLASRPQYRSGLSLLALWRDQ